MRRGWGARPLRSTRSSRAGRHSLQARRACHNPPFAWPSAQPRPTREPLRGCRPSPTAFPNKPQVSSSLLRALNAAVARGTGRQKLRRASEAALRRRTSLKNGLTARQRHPAICLLTTRPDRPNLSWLPGSELLPQLIQSPSGLPSLDLDYIIIELMVEFLRRS